MTTIEYKLDQKKYIDVAREKVNFFGKNEATIQELLAIIIGNSAKPEICGQLAALSIRDLLQMTAKDFQTLYGVSKLVGERLEASIGLANLLSRQSLPKSYFICSPDAAYKYFSFLRHEEQEQFAVAFLNTKMEVIGREVIFKGTMDTCPIHPREVFRSAIQKGAKSIILAHQHPSGSPEPSTQDIRINSDLVECGEVLGIEVNDHLIIGDGVYISLKEKGYM